MSLDIDGQYDKIYKYCYFKTNNVQIAEDITQETFLRYFSTSTYINKGKPLAYLYTIARNLCIDTYRKQTFEALDDNIEQKDNFENVITIIALNEAISALPKDLQEIILLRFSNELSIGEIGNIFEISRFAVYRKINRALQSLKVTLKEEDFFE